MLVERAGFSQAPTGAAMVPEGMEKVPCQVGPAERLQERGTHHWWTFLLPDCSLGGREGGRGKLDGQTSGPCAKHTVFCDQTIRGQKDYSRKDGGRTSPAGLGAAEKKVLREL